MGRSILIVVLSILLGMALAGVFISNGFYYRIAAWVITSILATTIWVVIRRK